MEKAGVDALNNLASFVGSIMDDRIGMHIVEGGVHKFVAVMRKESFFCISSTENFVR